MCAACREEVEQAWEAARRWRRRGDVLQKILVHGVTEKEKVERLDAALKEWVSDG